MAKEKKMHNKSLGKRGEDAAARYLEKHDYEIIERNWTCPAGEVDIIARDFDALVFCEVKTRTNINKGFPTDAVDEKKRAKYEQIAMWYLRDYEFSDAPVRFDVISIMAVNDERALLRHYVNAFSKGNDLA